MSRSLGFIIDHRTVAEVKCHFVTDACFIGISIYIYISIDVLFALFHLSSLTADRFPVAFAFSSCRNSSSITRRVADLLSNC